jgi:hypothetical protein
MADPTTLKALADANLTACQARANAAQSESAAAQTAITAALAALPAASAALAAANAESQRVRAALAAIPTSADAGPLLNQLDTATVAQRDAEAAVLAADLALGPARARLERAALAVRDAETDRVRAQIEADAATREAARIAGLVAALGQPPLDTLVADATALLGSATLAAAKTAAEKDLPAKLLARARDRVTLLRQRMAARGASRDAFAALIAAQVAANGSSTDQLAGPQAAYAAALAALDAYVSRAGQRLGRAQGTLTRLADPAQKLVLTPAQVARLKDAAQAAARATAADDEQALDQARRDREKAEQARDLERAKRAAGAPDDLAAKEAALVVDQGKETAAAATFAPERALLRAWEAAAPDGIWADLAAYDDAKATIDDLSAHPPGPLVTDLEAKEATLVAALVALGKEQAARGVYAAELAARTVAADADAGAADRLAYAALRGDA